MIRPGDTLTYGQKYQSLRSKNGFSGQAVFAGSL